MEAAQKLAVYGRADADGMVSCVTCNNRLFVGDKGTHGGHFISRKTRQTCYLMLNIWPQCESCNCAEHDKGKPVEFARFLGPGRVSTLKMLAEGELPFRTAGNHDAEKLLTYLICEVRPALKKAKERIPVLSK